MFGVKRKLAAQPTDQRDRITVRGATIDDLRAVLAIEFGGDDWDEDSLASVLRDESVPVLVARLGFAVVGYAFGAVDVNRLDVFRIEKVVVHPGYLRRGVGRELVLAMRSRAFWGIAPELAKRRRVVAECSELNLPGLCLFRSCGFRFGRTVPDVYDVGEASIRQVWRPDFIEDRQPCCTGWVEGVA